ncbi:DHS-like NAD/FAD-binding domain-containing protein [Crepidotus variabilis]|uniref:NAD-dependent protein deacylase n=1 Tax=Crepidotus variabilis TaxID=179855 RepID=A0A9P6JVZ6_9AGAR|nr:DHS-like NAD/FAD-binding domain-containing protein [Crepidotus variabilis]
MRPIIVPPSQDIKAFQEVLKTSKNVIAVAGAGLSAASGIPTFRGAGGMWRKYVATDLATPEGFEDSPSLVWQFYHYRRESARKASPNDAHRTLAAFSQPQIRQRIAPGATFTLITQNVDNLSPRANNELAEHLPPGQYQEPSLFEMHGRLFDVLCTNEVCKHVEFNLASPICDGLAGTEDLVEQGVIDPIVDENKLPRCTKCGSLARPGVVWFGEMPHKLEQIDEIVGKADLCLVVGTSSVVYPAAGYAHQVKANGGKVAVFNLEKTDGDRKSDFRFLGACEEILPKALGLTKNDFSPDIPSAAKTKSAGDIFS